MSGRRRGGRRCPCRGGARSPGRSGFPQPRSREPEQAPGRRRAGPPPGCRPVSGLPGVDDETGRLVDDDDVGVLVDDAKATSPRSPPGVPDQRPPEARSDLELSPAFTCGPAGAPVTVGRDTAGRDALDLCPRAARRATPRLVETLSGSAEGTTKESVPSSVTSRRDRLRRTTAGPLSPRGRPRPATTESRETRGQQDAPDDDGGVSEVERRPEPDMRRSRRPRPWAAKEPVREVPDAPAEDQPGRDGCRHGSGAVAPTRPTTTTRPPR